jgi:hypothetical protein
MKGHFDMKDQGDITNYLGINVQWLPNGDVKLSQLHLVKQIIDEVKLSKWVGKQTPAASTKILQLNEKAPPFDNHFNYQSVVGKLNFLEKLTRPDITCLCNTSTRKILSRSQGNTRRSNYSHCKVLTRHFTSRNNSAPNTWQSIWCLRWCRFCRKLAQDDWVRWPQHRQISLWLRHFVCRLSYCMDIQITDDHHSVIIWSWICCSLWVFMRHDPTHELDQWVQATWFWSH